MSARTEFITNIYTMGKLTRTENVNPYHDVHLIDKMVTCKATSLIPPSQLNQNDYSHQGDLLGLYWTIPGNASIARPTAIKSQRLSSKPWSSCTRSALLFASGFSSPVTRPTRKAKYYGEFFAHGGAHGLHHFIRATARLFGLGEETGILTAPMCQICGKMRPPAGCIPLTTFAQPASASSPWKAGTSG